MNYLRRLLTRSRQVLVSREGNLAPVVVLSLVAVMVTAMAALMVSASLTTSAKSMGLVDASTDVTLDFSDQITNKPRSGFNAGDSTSVTSSHNGLTRQQGLVLGDDLLITGFDDDGFPVWGPAKGVEGVDGVWMRNWGTPGDTP